MSTTKEYIQKLRERYEMFPQMKEEIDFLDRTEKDIAMAPMLDGYRDHPVTESLLKYAKLRYEELANSLMTNRSLTSEERLACFIGMDWAAYYIDICDKKSDETLKGIDRKIMEIATRVLTPQ
jgi:hypothetical protein